MIDSRPIKLLRVVHMAILTGVVLMIVLLHMRTSGFLDFLRMPLFLRVIDPYIGSSYPYSFYVYHSILYFFFVLMVLDLFTFTFVESQVLKTISASFSLVGAALMAVLVGLFFYTLRSGGGDQFIFRGSLSYLIICSFLFLLFLLDIATFIRDETMLKRKRLVFDKKSKSHT